MKNKSILLFIFLLNRFASASVEVSKESVMERTYTMVSFSREDPMDVSYGTSLYIKDGYFLTAHHVVEGYETRSTGIEKGDERHLVSVDFIDESIDLALVHSDVRMEPLSLIFQRPQLLDKGFIFWCPGPDGTRAASCEISRLDYDFSIGGVTILADLVGYNGFMSYGSSGGLVFHENGSVAGMVNVIHRGDTAPELFGIDAERIREFIDRNLLFPVDP